MAATMPATKCLFSLLTLKHFSCADRGHNWETPPFGAEYTVALFFSVTSQWDSKLTKAQAGPLPPSQAGPHLMNSLLSLWEVMFVIRFTGYRCA